MERCADIDYTSPIKLAKPTRWNGRHDRGLPMVEGKQSDVSRIDATFRNGSLTAISVVVGFSLSFLSRWAGLSGQWHIADLAAVLLIILGIGCQIAAMTRMLWVNSLDLARYNLSIRLFLLGVVLVAAGVTLAIVGDITGYGQHVLGS